MTSDGREVIGNFEMVEGKFRTRREVLAMGVVAAGTALAAISPGKATDSPPDASPTAPPVTTAASTLVKPPQAFTAKDFSSLLNRKLEGLSAEAIEKHLKLYNAYVAKSNEIQGLLSAVDLSKPAANATYCPLRELLVEQSFALNGVIYHELYFGNLGGSGGEPGGELKTAVEASFGSVGKFMDVFKAAAKSMRGWVIVGSSTRDGQLHVFGLDAHNMHVPAGVIPVAVLDVYEHAYMIDYGIDRGSYLEAFLKNMDWDACNKRLASARKYPVGPESTV